MNKYLLLLPGTFRTLLDYTILFSLVIFVTVLLDSLRVKDEISSIFNRVITRTSVYTFSFFLLMFFGYKYRSGL